MGRPRKDIRLSKGGYNGRVLVSFRDDNGKSCTLTAPTTSKAVAKRMAPELISDYFERKSKRELAKKDTQESTRTQLPILGKTFSEIAPDWKMSQLIEYWFTSMGGSEAETTRKHKRSAGRNWIKHVGDTTLSDVSSDLVEKWKRSYLNEINEKKRLQNPDHVNLKSTDGIRNYVGDLQSIWAVLMNSKIVDSNPFAGAKPPAVELDVAGRAWSEETEADILEASERFAASSTSSFAEVMPFVIRFLLNTGMRPKELTFLRGEDIKEDQHGVLCAFIRKSSAKSGKARKVPLNKEAYDAVKSMSMIAMIRQAEFSNSIKSATRIASEATRVPMSGTKALQFMNRNHEQREEWLRSTEWTKKSYVLMVKPPHRVRVDTLGDIFAEIRATTKYKDTDIVLYDARHTFAVNFLDDGSQPITKLASILGHSDIKLTQRYARTDRLTVPDFERPSAKQDRREVDPADKLIVPDRNHKTKDPIFG